MAYWSITCRSTSDVYVSEANVLLERGINVFTVISENTDELTSKLESFGVLIDRVYRLDDFEAVPALEEGGFDADDVQERSQGQALGLCIEQRGHSLDRKGIP